MNIFSNSFGIYLLLLLPFLFLLIPFNLAAVKSRKEKWGGDLMKHYSFTARRRYKFIKMALFSISLVFLFVAFARPQWGEVEKKTAMSDLDIVLLVDVSKSMNVEDIKPSRLERARMEVRSLIEDLEGARMGLVAFTALPVVLSPLTDDKGALALLFEIADTKLIPALGTDLGKGVEESLRLFSYDEERAKILIVFSDGEDMGNTAFKAAGAAQNLQVKIFSVGLGTTEGGVVKDEKGSAIIDPSTQKEGISSLDPNKLAHIAKQTDGRYFEIGKEGRNLNELKEELARIKKREYATKQKEKREEKFGIFAAGSLILLFLIPLMPMKKKEAEK